MFEINRKLVAVFAIIIILALIVFIWSDSYISKSFELSKDERQIIRDFKSTLQISMTEHYIFTPENLETLAKRIQEDTGLHVVFKTVEDAVTPLIKFPSGIYGSPNLLYHLDIGYLTGDYQSIDARNYKMIEYPRRDLMMNALTKGDIQGILLPYAGDYLYDEELSLISYSEENPATVSFETDAKAFEPIIVKLFRTYQRDGLFESYKNDVNQARLDASGLVWPDMSDIDLNVGIIQQPSTAYIKDKNVYGLSVVLIKQLAELMNYHVVFTVGEYDKIKSLYTDGTLDLIISHKAITSSLNFFREPFVVVSKTDTDFHEDAYFDLQNVISYYDVQLPFDYRLIPNYDDFITSLEQSDDYFVMPLSFYQLTQEKLDLPDLYVNNTLDQSMSYYFTGDTTLLSHMEKLLQYVDEKRLLVLSQRTIPDERAIKTKSVIFITVGIILGIILFIYLMFRIILSINERQRLNYLFKYDQLTYLPNINGMRNLFASKSFKNGALALIDLRHFKLVNDTYGTEIGDQILIELTTHFKAIHPNLFVGRTSGDQFMFIIHQENYKIILDTILSTFMTYKHSVGHAAKLNISSCYVDMNVFGHDFETLNKYLESCMHYAKSESITNRWVEFDESLYASYLDEQELVIEIERALQDDQFQLFYQPQTELRQEKTIGAEVLIRWHHESRGPIYPDQFLGVAERNGLMKQIDMYMIKKACQQIKTWQDLGYDKMKISVNMSTYTFENKNMTDELLKIVQASGIDTTWFALEITEESGLSNLEKAKFIMDQIKAHGIRFALDDFGKGYSSISYLEKLPFDFLKIDKAFVDYIHTDAQSRALYGLITDLAKLYDMHIIAEGVEYPEQIEVIKKDIDTIIQGYYYSKPLNVEDFENRIKNQ